VLFDALRRDDDSVPLVSKKNQFLEGVQKLMKVIEGNEISDKMIFVVMIFNMVRLIQATNLHPRLALMTGTIGYAAEALTHAIAVACLVFFGFAYIGVWRFGHQREEFGDMYTAMATELSIMFSSETPEDWEQDGEFMLFIFLYLFFMFILVLNFVLAIIVSFLPADFHKLTMLPLLFHRTWTPCSFIAMADKRAIIFVCLSTLLCCCSRTTLCGC